MRRHVDLGLLLLLCVGLAHVRASYIVNSVAYAKSHCHIDGPNLSGGDCAHFVAQIIAAGGCVPNLDEGSDLMDFCQYGGKYFAPGAYDLCWTDSHQSSWGLPGLGDWLRQRGWRMVGTTKDHVKAGYVVFGDASLGPWSHTAFGIGDNVLVAHTKNHCNSKSEDIFVGGIDAIYAPPCSCVPCCEADKCPKKVCQDAYCSNSDECAWRNDDTDAKCPEVPKALCQRQGCKGGDCVTNIAVPNDGRCSGQAPNPSTIFQSQQCYDWNCVGGSCVWQGSTALACTRYEWPPGAPAKDRQCWRPLCQNIGGTVQCAGVAADLDHASCPAPVVNGQPVSPYCYVPACESNNGGLTGYCSTSVFTSAGGLDQGSPHAGNCLVPPQYSPQCAWPYCDANGQCAVNIFVGKPYTPEGNWQDGTPGARPWDYVVHTIPYDAGNTQVFPGNQFCTIADSMDDGNTRYPNWNGQCATPRCMENGKCGVDATNFGQPCVPIDGRATGGYNEVFVGAPNWPGVVPECVFYTCGDTAGEYGHCVQRNLPGGRTHTCENSDNDLCTYDWCDGLGMCKDHEWKEGRSPEGVCVVDQCDPATGLWTYTRNGDACCGNGQINTGEQCEPGMGGADSLCCVNCYLQTTCDDGNVCTDETCTAAGTCTRTFNPANVAHCPPLDLTVPDNLCKMSVCAQLSDPQAMAECQVVADPTKEGTACIPAAADDPCTQHVCRSGVCSAEPANQAEPCTDPTVPAPDQRPVCTKYVCAPATDGSAGGACVAVPDVTAACDDKDLCTTNACADVNGVGTCVVASTLSCVPSANECLAPPVCDPHTGACLTLPLNGAPCERPANYTPQRPADGCNSFVCIEGVCMRSMDMCPCGNGRLDLGETCDWSMNAFESCCAMNCTGCLCGNGRLDAGEQCDFGIPDQIGCCNATCQGCLCGNGQIDDGEQCDPGITHQAECCSESCKGCAAASTFNRVAASAAIGAGVLSVALIAAAAVAVAMSRAAPVTGAASGDGAAGVVKDNPMYSAQAGSANPLYAL